MGIAPCYQPHRAPDGRDPVYGGDFFAAERSEWDAKTLCEGHYDADKVMRLFEESNGTFAAAR